MRITVRALALMTSLVTIPAAAGTAVVFFSQPAASSCTNRDARGPTNHDPAQEAGAAQFTQPPADTACRLQTPPPPLSSADSQLFPWDPMFPPSPAEWRLGPERPSFGAFLRQPRLACEEIVHREAALQGYLKSRLRLTPAQKEAWHKVELAAEPAVNRQRELCEQLPLEAANPPTCSPCTNLQRKCCPHASTGCVRPASPCGPSSSRFRRSIGCSWLARRYCCQGPSDRPAAHLRPSTASGRSIRGCGRPSVQPSLNPTVGSARRGGSTRAMACLRDTRLRVDGTMWYRRPAIADGLRVTWTTP